MAAQYPLQPQPETTQRTMGLDCLLGVTGATWVVAAIIPQQGTDQIHVTPDKLD